MPRCRHSMPTPHHDLGEVRRAADLSDPAAPRAAWRSVVEPSTTERMTRKAAWIRLATAPRGGRCRRTGSRRRHGVVLVDDGDDAEREEPFEGSARVGVVASRVTSSAVSSTWPTVKCERRRRAVCGDKGACPTLAAACWVARSRGHHASPSGPSPAAMAPDETSTTEVPACRRAASTLTRAQTRRVETTVRPGQRGGPRLDDEPVGGGDGGRVDTSSESIQPADAPAGRSGRAGVWARSAPGGCQEEVLPLHDEPASSADVGAAGQLVERGDRHGRLASSPSDR